MENKTIEHVGTGHKVTSLELFFDLVFVFAITQVTSFLSHNFTPEGIIEGVLILALMWWAWVAYTWLGTTIRFDEGRVRILLLMAMGAILLVSLGIPEAFHDLPGGFDNPIGTPTVMAVAYASVRILHLFLYAIAGKGNPHLLGAVLRFGIPVLVGLGFFILGTFQTGTTRIILYAVAVVIDFGGALVGGGKGWTVHAAHFAERHGLVIPIALGESVVAVGAGASGSPLSWQISVAALLGLGVSACLFWIYFDVTSLAAERRLAKLQNDQRNRAARDAFSYLHFPMVAGIVFLALGFKKVLSIVSDYPENLFLVQPSASAVLWLGAALYLFGHVGFRLRLTKTWSIPRLTAGVLFLVASLFSGVLPALLSLSALFAFLILVVLWETISIGELGKKLRHSESHEK